MNFQCQWVSLFQVIVPFFHFRFFREWWVVMEHSWVKTKKLELEMEWKLEKICFANSQLTLADFSWPNFFSFCHWPEWSVLLCKFETQKDICRILSNNSVRLKSWKFSILSGAQKLKNFKTLISELIWDRIDTANYQKENIMCTCNAILFQCQNIECL